jgi:HEAT repeat protein
MKRKWRYAFVAALILVAVVFMLRQNDMSNRKPIASSRDQSASQDKQDGPFGGNDLATPASGSTGSKMIDAEHKENVRKGLEAIFERLKQKGVLREVPLTAKQLQDAIESKDHAAIHQAFQDAIYASSARMSEAIPAIKAYLISSDPYVRYLAAEALLRVGDQSGVDALLAIVQNNELVARGEKDLRIAAATTLAVFNVSAAAEGIRDLYSRTREGQLLRSLSALGIQAREATVWNYVSSAPAIENYAKEGSTRFIGQISETFQQSSDLATKNAAAWSLARMTGGDQYVEHLIEAARPAIGADSSKGGFNESTEALRYLGSIQAPAAVDVLEQALSSQNPVAVQYATVNLLFNQPGGSEEAEQLVLNELRTSPQNLGNDLTMKIASKLDNPEIRAAAKAYDLRTGGDRWRYWGVERSNWPIEN